MKKCSWIIALLLALLTAFIFTGCNDVITDIETGPDTDTGPGIDYSTGGGGGADVPIITGVNVSFTGSPSVVIGTTRQFSAEVVGKNDPIPQTVTWSITTADIAAGTTISASGLLTVDAAETPKSLTVRATSTVDTTKYGTATVNVITAPPTVTSVTISPQSALVLKGGTQTFSAVVNGTNGPSQTVIWSIVETGLASGTGINSSTGLLTVAATESLTSLTVRATSTEDPTKSDTATVTVIGLTISPASANVTKGSTQQFTATVTGTSNTAVTWSIDEAGKNVGTTISSTGLLTVAAGESLTSLTVRAALTDDPTKSVTATVNVRDAPPTVTSVTVSPATAIVVKGGTKTFNTSVIGTNGPSQAVT